MKKFILLAACMVAVMMYSCTKDAFTADSGISASIDGLSTNFNAIDSVGYSNTSRLYQMSVSGKTSTAADADILQLNVFSATPIAVGSYTLSPTSNTPPYYPLVVYKPKGSTNFADDYVVDYTGNHPVTITITALTNKSVQGTFSGTLVVAAGSSGATKTFTNGTFNVTAK